MGPDKRKINRSHLSYLIVILCSQIIVSLRRLFWVYPQHMLKFRNKKIIFLITHSYLTLGADHFCKQFGTRSGPTKLHKQT